MGILRKLIDGLHKRADEQSVQPKSGPNEQFKEVAAQGPSSGVPTGQETLEVPDPWGVGGLGPFVLERRPNINVILSTPNPTPPKPAAEWNKYFEHSAEDTREYLAMAYMHHPSTEVREATIRFVGSRPKKELSVGLILAQRLTVDPAEDLRRVAAEAIWSRGQEELLEAMKYLAGNDESPGDDGNGAFVSRPQVRVAIQTLHDTNPASERDFMNALLYAWCWHDERLAGFGQTLIELWLNRKTFSDDQSRTIAREVGVKLHTAGGIDAMKMMFRPVTLLVGSDAASELNHAWSGIGGWQP